MYIQFSWKAGGALGGRVIYQSVSQPLQIRGKIQQTCEIQTVSDPQTVEHADIVQILGDSF